MKRADGIFDGDADLELAELERLGQSAKDCDHGLAECKDTALHPYDCPLLTDRIRRGEQ